MLSKTHMRVRDACVNESTPRTSAPLQSITFAMVALVALMGGFAIGAIFAISFEKRQPSPENQTPAPGRGFLAVSTVEDGSDAQQRASKLRKILNQSSQIWKLNRRAYDGENGILKQSSHVSVDNPLVVDLSSHGAEARVHEFSGRLNVLATQKEDEFNHEEEALDIFVGATSVGFNGITLSIGELSLPEFRQCSGACEEVNQYLKGKFRHRTGAALMELAMSRTTNLTHFFEAICPTGDVTLEQSQTTWNFLHGGIPHWAAMTLAKPGDVWKRFFTDVMPSTTVPVDYRTTLAAFHGVGHAVLLVSAMRANESLQAEYTKYHPTWDDGRTTVPEAVFLEVDSICADGPTEYAIFSCATGLIHHLIEHASIANESSYDWSYPCDKASSFWTASACFAFTMGIIQEEMRNAWRFQKVLTQPDAWSQLCMRLSPEHVVRGCIFGLSRNMFLPFENSVAEASLELVGEASASYSDVMSTREEVCEFYGNKVSCAMVSREQPHATSSGQALVQWCSRFVATPSGDFNESQLLRFYSCVAGSEWVNSFSSDVDLESHCSQLNSTDWHANITVRSTATNLCIRTVKASARRLAVPWPALETPTEGLALSLS